MKKVLVLLLLMVSTSVFAEWTVVGSDDDGMTSYADFGAIKRKGNKVNMWSLIDFKTVQEGPGGERYLSGMSRDEYDCEEESRRVLDMYMYSGNMRGGEIVYSAPNMKREAASVTPGGKGEIFLKIACGKK